MNKAVLFLLIVVCFISCRETPVGVELKTIEIIRDSFGVPHIYASTDAEVAYGLAWAQCEDDFMTLQEQMSAIKGRYGEIKGKDGIVADFGIKFMGLREVVEAKYESDISADFKKVLEGFVDGANAYARLNPHRLLLKDLFPLHEHDLVVGYLLGLVNLSGAGNDLGSIMDGSITQALEQDLPTGSNAIAVSKRKNPEGNTLLAINSHQPLEGWYSWYEAHLVSDEGTNILGGTFPGGVTIFHGVNENLGWAHTVNHADFSDVYQLTMHPEHALTYRFDGEWLQLKEKKYKSWLKVWGPIKIPINRSIYESVYGPTFETENGFFSWRYVANQDIRAAEQWYRMNKATDLQSFLQAIDIQGIPSTNVVYADKNDNIYYLSNGRLPRRNENYNWKGILPGDTSATLWHPKEIFTIDYLPQIMNPECGYVFNTNNTPFTSSGDPCDPDEPYINKTMGYQPTGMENNRSKRLSSLLVGNDSITYQKFSEIKFDIQYPDTLIAPQMINLELMLKLKAEDHPEIASTIRSFEGWDRRMTLDSEEATLFILSLRYLQTKLESEYRWRRGSEIMESDVTQAFAKAQQYLMDHFGALEVPLKDFQIHSRGDQIFPIEGGPDVLAAIHSRPIDDGRYRAVAGESYIMMVQFTPQGPIIETVNAFGSNAIAGDPASTNQMELFVSKQLKPMSLNLEEIKNGNSVRITHPKK